MQHTWKCEVCLEPFYTYCFGSDGSGDIVYDPPLLPEPYEIYTVEDNYDEVKAYAKRRMSLMAESRIIPLCAKHLEIYHATL